MPRTAINAHTETEADTHTHTHCNPIFNFDFILSVMPDLESSMNPVLEKLCASEEYCKFSGMQSVFVIISLAPC